MSNEERDTSIAELYASGTTLEAIGRRFEMTRERVRQIVRERGATSADEARRLRRRMKADELATGVAGFLDQYRGIVEDLATAGVSRPEVEARFALALPEVPGSTVRHALDSAGTLFDKAVKEVTFSDSVLESALWFALARENALDPDPMLAITDMDLAETRDLSRVLQSRGIRPETIAGILGAVHAARRHAIAADDTGISSKRYTEQRDRILAELGMDTTTAAVPWPPTSMTLAKRLGNNSWADAQRRLGLVPDSRGRPRGLLDFTEADYVDAIRDFLTSAQAIGSARSFDAYNQWVEREERAGRRRPAGASVRMRFRGWNAAKRVVAGADGGGAGDVDRAARGPVRAVTALHDAQATIDRHRSTRETTPPSDRLSVVEAAVKSIVEEFEFRRRHWLRAAILADEHLVTRRLDDAGVSRKERTALEGGTSAVADLLSDRYLDRLGGSDPTQTGGWLRPDVQTELSATPTQTVRAFRVLKEYRNLLTHNSMEARDRLTGALGELDARFTIRQSITSRTLGRWLIGARAERLDTLLSSVPTLWRAMIVAESVLLQRLEPVAHPPAAENPETTTGAVDSLLRREP